MTPFALLVPMPDPSILPNNGVLPVLGQLRADPFVLNVQNDGNVVVSKTSGAGVGVVWQTLTGGHVCSPSSPQQCVSGLIMQGGMMCARASCDSAIIRLID